LNNLLITSPPPALISPSNNHVALSPHANNGDDNDVAAPTPVHKSRVKPIPASQPHGSPNDAALVEPSSGMKRRTAPTTPDEQQTLPRASKRRVSALPADTSTRTLPTTSPTVSTSTSTRRKRVAFSDVVPAARSSPDTMQPEHAVTPTHTSAAGVARADGDAPASNRSNGVPATAAVAAAVSTPPVTANTSASSNAMPAAAAGGSGGGIACASASTAQTLSNNHVSTGAPTVNGDDDGDYEYDDDDEDEFDAMSLAPISEDDVVKMLPFPYIVS
jgi:hypothetical protein